MPEVTDLRVAQWAKSSSAPSDVYNAACRMLNGDLRLVATVNGALYRSAEGDVSAVIAELAAIDAEMDEFASRHNPECECEVIHSTREVARRIKAALSGAESHGDGRPPQTLGAGEGQEATEAHGAAQ